MASTPKSGSVSPLGATSRATVPALGHAAVIGARPYLQQFIPTSTTTWWAVVSDRTGNDEWLVRTSDSGHHWTRRSPTPGQISPDVLNATTAWVTSLTGEKALFRTTDGGQNWQRLGHLPAACDTQFIDRQHGWCVHIGAASGSESVTLWRTYSGGTAWTLASRTPAGDEEGTPGALPFGCDKSVTFTSPTVGWAPFFCNGGTPDLYKTTDAGATWHPTTAPPLPPGISTNGGAGYSNLVADGPHLAVVASLPQRATAIDTSNDGGQHWTMHAVPNLQQEWGIQLLDPTRWRLTDSLNTVIQSTDDAGRHWRTQPLPKHSQGAQSLTLTFLAPRLAWWVPFDPNGGPIWWTTGGSVWRPVTIDLD